MIPFVQTVDFLSSLSNDTQAIVYLMARENEKLRGYFMYDPQSTAQPDGVNIISYQSGPGRWLRMTFVKTQAPADTAADADTTYSQAQVQSIITELRSLKDQLKAAQVLL